MNFDWRLKMNLINCSGKNAINFDSVFFCFHHEHSSDVLHRYRAHIHGDLNSISIATQNNHKFKFQIEKYNVINRVPVLMMSYFPNVMDRKLDFADNIYIYSCLKTGKRIFDNFHPLFGRWTWYTFHPLACYYTNKSHRSAAFAVWSLVCVCLA